MDEQILELAQLSTGQQQRLAIARAKLKNADVIILDEATANLDVNTEKRIVDKWKEALPDKMFIIVTHKDVFDAWGTQFLDLGLPAETEVNKKIEN